MAYLYYVAICGIFDNVKRSARLDRSMGAISYPSVAKAGAEKHLASLLKDRNFTQVGPVAPCVIEVKMGGSTGAKVGATEIAAMFAGKGQGLVGSPKLPAKVASAIAKGIAAQGAAKPASKPAKPASPARKAEKVDAAPVAPVDATPAPERPTLAQLMESGLSRHAAKKVVEGYAELDA